VVQKSAQTGLTTFGINRALWFGDTHQVAVIYTFPTAGDVSEFSKARVTPIIRASPHLMGRIADVDSVELKQIGQSFIYFRGTWSERQAISIPADMLVHDETDRSKPEVLSMYRERLSHSKYKYIVNLSNPSIPGYGVNALYLRSDMKKWFVQCPKCGKEQVLKYPDSIRIGERTYYQCVFCGAELSDGVRKQGKWKPTNKGARISGYHISQLMAPWISAEEIVEKKENERWLQTFYNFVLGLPYAGENVPIKRTDLLECVQNKYDLEQYGRGTYMGVDQGDELHVVIFQRGEANRIVWCGVLDSFDELPNLMDNYQVVSCVIDAMPNKHSARRFAYQYPGRVWLCYYSDTQKEPVKWTEDDEKKEWRVVAQRTESLDAWGESVTSHSVILPKVTQIIDVFIRHSCNLARDRVEKPDGTIIWKYLAVGPDHFAHAANYGMIALSRAPVGSLAETSKRSRKKDRPMTAGLMDKEF